MVCKCGHHHIQHLFDKVCHGNGCRCEKYDRVLRPAIRRFLRRKNGSSWGPGLADLI
jgi:hypothetical protein